MKFQYNNGGGPDAKKIHNCVARAIAIITEQPYATVAAEINRLADTVYYDGSDAEHSVQKQLWKDYLTRLGYVWTPTMKIGSGCTVHLREGELPAGRLIVSVSRHLVAVIDGTIHDTFDCSRDGTRCVYGYFSKH